MLQLLVVVLSVLVEDQRPRHAVHSSNFLQAGSRPERVQAPHRNQHPLLCQVENSWEQWKCTTACVERK